MNEKMMHVFSTFNQFSIPETELNKPMKKYIPEAYAIIPSSGNWFKLCLVPEQGRQGRWRSVWRQMDSSKVPRQHRAAAMLLG